MTTAQRDTLAAQTAAAQRLLDALLVEQRDTPDEIARVRRSGDAAAYAQSLLRRDNLPHEIRDAQVALARAQLTQTWAAAGPAITAADTARDAYLSAAADRATHESQPRPPAGSATAAAAQQIEHAQLDDAVTAARAAHDDAERAAAVLLYEIDQLEDTVELLTGERPDPANDNTPPRTLTNTVVLTAPTGYGNDVRVFEAGTAPPRWAQFLLRHSDTVWTGTPRPTAPAGPSMLVVTKGLAYPAGVLPNDAA